MTMKILNGSLCCGGASLFSFWETRRRRMQIAFIQITLSTQGTQWAHESLVDWNIFGILLVFLRRQFIVNFDQL